MESNSAQVTRFTSLKRNYTAKSFFLDRSEKEEFEKYWKRYAKRIMAAQEKNHQKKMRCFFSYLEEKNNDDLFVKDFMIKKISSEKGYGVVTKKNIPKNRVITHYAGVIRKDNGKWGEHNRYIFGFTGTEKLKNWVIDAERTCNLASFMNHSSEPNVESFEYYDEKGPKVVFISIKNIKQNEELVYDYGNDYWKGLKERPV